MAQQEKQRVLITGASGGIGLAIAEEFARCGHSLFLVARSEEKLAAESRRLARTYDVEAEYLPADLTDPDSPRRVFSAANATDDPITILVNNAGFATYGPFVERPLDSEVAMVRLNIEALLVLTRLFLPTFVAHGNAGVINVASTAAFQPGPLMATYYASKAFVLSFGYALAEELKDTGVTVTTLCPGPTKSDFQERAEMQQSRLLKMGTMSSRSVAKAAVRGYFQKKTIVVPGAFNKTGAFATRIFSRRLISTVVRRLQSPE